MIQHAFKVSAKLRIVIAIFNLISALDLSARRIVQRSEYFTSTVCFLDFMKSFIFNENVWTVSTINVLIEEKIIAQPDSKRKPKFNIINNLFSLHLNILRNVETWGSSKTIKVL